MAHKDWKQMALGIDADLHAELREIAHRSDRSMSWIVRQAIKLWIEQQRKLLDGRPA